jgi:hypothetical protein
MLLESALRDRFRVEAQNEPANMSWRTRSAAALLQGNLGFFTWGPYETQMNVFTFDKYHLFRGKARLLPGFEQVPDEDDRSAVTLIEPSLP